MEMMNLGIEQFNMNRFDTSSIAGSINRANPTTQDFRDLFEKIRSEDSSAAVVDGRRVVPNDVDKNDKLFQLCLELETFLVKNLLSGMRNTVQKSGLIEESYAGKIYEDMLYDEYAKDITKNKGFGLAEQAYRQLSA